MANTYAANFGDVVKHAVLCDVISRIRPQRYLESHGGRLAYDLAALDPGPGGVWDYLELAGRDGSVDDSVYGRLVSAAAGRPDDPGTYPGSVALAHECLAAEAEIVVYELVDASAADLRDGLARRGRAAEVIVGDGLAGVCAVAAPGDLVLLDPFDVLAGDGTLTAAAAFRTLASRGVATLLWYAIYDPADTGDWISASTAGLDVWAIRLIGDTSLGGLAGCGFLGAQLDRQTTDAASRLVDAVAQALAPVRPGLHRR